VNFDGLGQSQVPLETTQANQRRVADRTDNRRVREVREPGPYGSGGKIGHDSAHSTRPGITATRIPEFFIKKYDTALRDPTLR
jgi:hypothetical protein